ncbi:MAG: hypothetical protein ACOCQG_03955 [Candidatus Nanoarchaeia archaeon]
MDSGIKEVMDLEKKSDDIIQKANEKAQSIREKSKKELYDLKARREAGIDEKKSRLIKNAERDISKKKKEILNQGENEREKLLEKSKEKTDEAIGLIIEKLKKAM